MTERAASIVLIVSFLGLFTAVPAFAEDLSAQSVWAAAPPRIDGLAEEWNGGAVTVHKKTKAECAFRNDADNLYILLAFKDPAFLSTLDKSGVTIFFDAGGKNRKDRGLKFTKAMLTADQLIARRRSQGRELTEEQIAEIKGKPFHPMFMFGVINKNDHALMAKAKPSFSPDFNASQEGDVRVYEIKIPLIRDDNQPFGIGIGTGPGQAVKVGIEWGGRTEAPGQQEADFTRRISDRDAPGIETQIRKGTPKYTCWVAVALAAKT